MRHTVRAFCSVTSLLVMLAGIPLPAAAAPIIVDPGPLGPTPAEFDIDFDALDGTAVDGQSLALDFLFAGEKWIYTSSGTHGVLLLLQTTNIGASIDTGLQGTGYFLDGLGVALHGVMPLFYPSGTNDGGLLAASLYSGAAMGQPNPIDAPFRYFGVHYEFTLPAMAGVEITGARLRIVRSDFVSVAEPASLAMLGLGLAGLFASRSRRRR